MNDSLDILSSRLDMKQRRLSQLQQTLLINTKNMKTSSTYEDDTIRELLEIRKLKAEIAELEVCVRIMETMC
ncbi:MAG: hypothetical protein E7554_08565 [Ruminococcaceae bacterium]|nr:hypothetical protein [Oscillospiraceae bacterium]